MSSLKQLVNRVRGWRLWRALRRPARVPVLVLDPMAPIFRDVSPHGVRVYSLCGTCGTQLERSATLCEECAQSRIR